MFTSVMKDALYVEMKLTLDTFLDSPETGKYWKIEREFLNKIFLNMDEELTYKKILDEELTYKKILKENIHIYFSNVYLKLTYSFQTYCVHFAGECD